MASGQTVRHLRVRITMSPGTRRLARLPFAVKQHSFFRVLPMPSAPPAVPARVRRGRGAYFGNHLAGRLPAPLRLPFRHRISAICGTAASWPLLREDLSLGLGWQTGAIRAGSGTVAGETARQPTQRASRVSSHLLSFQDAGRLPVNVGWRHPRPVAANDALSLTRRAGHGDKPRRPASIRHLYRPILWFGPSGASFRPGRPFWAPPRAAAVKDGALARHPGGARP
jgi:hypothetical protein